MKPVLRASFLVTGVLLLCVVPARAQIQPSVSAFAGSPYVWRGQVFSTGWVLQPTVSASYAGFSATYFGNFDPNSVWAGGNPHLQESDLTLAYGVDVGKASVAAGYTFYTFPTPGTGAIKLLPTQELFASIGYAAAVSPSLFVAYDFDERDDNALQGLYAEAKLSAGTAIRGQVYALAATLGLDSGYMLIDEAGKDRTALSHLALTGSSEFSAGGLSISPMIGLQVSLDDDYKSLFGNTRFQENFGGTFLYGGLTVGF